MKKHVESDEESGLAHPIDARGLWAPDPGFPIGRHAIIAFSGQAFDETFVDSLTIRNNMGGTLDPSPIGYWGDGTGAGIFIGGESPCMPIISNNFIVDNIVGIGIENDTSSFPAVPVHEPMIVNNTIDVPDLPEGLFYGIWSGDRLPLDAVPPNTRDNLNYGRARPFIYNNIVSAPRVAPLPLGAAPAAITGAVALAGIHWDDMIVTRAVVAPFILLPSINYNAFQPGAVWNVVLPAGIAAYTIPAAPFSGLWPLPAIQPITPVTNTNMTPPTAVITRVGSTPAIPLRFVPGDLAIADITPWTPVGGGGTLFIRDVFRNYIDAGAAPRCQHDYRLAPTVRTPAGVASTNPLIGQGINLNWDGVPNSGGNIVSLFSFGQIGYTGGQRDISTPPGIARNPDLQDVPTFAPHAWDFDGADGWGNPRFEFNVPLVQVPALAVGDVDLGADEVGEVVISGYLNSTRIFSQPHFVAAGSVPLTQFCVNPYHFWTAGANLPRRPQFTFYYGFVQPWYQHTEGSEGLGVEHAPDVAGHG